MKFKYKGKKYETELDSDTIYYDEYIIKLPCGKYVIVDSWENGDDDSDDVLQPSKMVEIKSSTFCTDYTSYITSAIAI